MTTLHEGLLNLGRIWWRGLPKDALLAAIPGAVLLLWIGQEPTEQVLRITAEALQTGVWNPLGAFFIARLNATSAAWATIFALSALLAHVSLVRQQWQRLTHDEPASTNPSAFGFRVAMATLSGSILYVALCLSSLAPTPWLLAVFQTTMPLPISIALLMLWISCAAVPAIWLSVALLPLPYLAALHGGSPLANLRESRRIMRGRWWITSLYTSVTTTVYLSLWLLIPLLIATLTFVVRQPWDVHDHAFDAVQWLATSVTISRWVMWPIDALCWPLLHATALVTVHQGLYSVKATEAPPRPPHQATAEP